MRKITRDYFDENFPKLVETLINTSKGSKISNEKNSPMSFDKIVSSLGFPNTGGMYFSMKRSFTKLKLVSFARGSYDSPRSWRINLDLVNTQSPLYSISDIMYKALVRSVVMEYERLCSKLPHNKKISEENVGEVAGRTLTKFSRPTTDTSPLKDSLQEETLIFPTSPSPECGEIADTVGNFICILSGQEKILLNLSNLEVIRLTGSDSLVSIILERFNAKIVG
jgi:hypothetical protein